ncbi:MAG: acyl-CoA thioesterase domain-containing protein [Myxococcota bacterium]|nr:acyl-CoA thioesterase domain-containing protein [Myxococcota bacterium]
MPLITWEDTLGCLEVREVGDDLYTAENIPMPYHRIFGGQLLAQASAVSSAVGEGKSVKSMHVVFPAEGDLSEPVEYALRRLRSGRTFAALGVDAVQASRGSILSATVSLHAPEEGFSHQVKAPALGGPEEASSTDLSMIPWETRVVGGVDLAAREAGPPEYAFWMRTPSLPEGQALHQGLLAHATDLTAIGTALRPQAGLGEADAPERIHSAVTSHTIWFHRPFRVDDWLLIQQRSPVAAGSRGFAQGDVFTASGHLVASFAQESLLRLRDSPA